jgi:hypothetical protein
VYLKHNSFYKHAPLKRAGYIPNKNELWLNLENPKSVASLKKNLI